MMRCNPDGRDKHMRWFWMDMADDGTIELSWGKKPRQAVKGPYTLTGVEEDGAGRPRFVMVGQARQVALVKPGSDTSSQAWLRVRNHW